MARKLSVRWHVEQSIEPALEATYKGHKLRMTWQKSNNMYVIAIDGVKRISGETKGECYRKIMDEAEFGS